MKSFRNRLRQAVLASIPALAVACTTPRHSGTSGGKTSGGSTSSGGSTGGVTSENLCNMCEQEGLTCNAHANGCTSYCQLCMCSPVSAPVGATDGGYPDGGLPPELCQAACRDPNDAGPGSQLTNKSWSVLACELGDGGCPPLPDGGDAGTSCVICTVEDCSGIGRVPEGLCAAPRSPAQDAMAVHFARAAHLEAASVVAFERMALELEGFGAPPELVARARRAAREEERHAELMGAQARRFGGQVSEVSVLPHRARSVEDFAVENAREGCVRETFGAAVIAAQALRASDAEIQRALSELAEDEAGHAELSWDIARWAEGRLTAAGRERVGQVMDQARGQLGFRSSASPEVERSLGQPNAEETQSLLAHLDRLIWT